MILKAGPLDCESFTDDTSLDARKTAYSKVSIHCQVMRECSLDWYFLLLPRAPSTAGELKASHVTPIFLSLSDSERRKVLSTLRFVRVNITDPRPYIASVDAILGGIVPGVNAKEFRARLLQTDKDTAERVKRESRRLAVDRMFSDSPSERLKLMVHVLTSFPELPSWATYAIKQQSQESDFNVRVFPGSRSRFDAKCDSVFVSKSGSVFFPAIDTMEGVMGSALDCRPVTPQHLWGLYRTLGHSHAFDDGNKQAMKWIEMQRSHVLTKIDPYRRVFPNIAPRPLQVIDSKKSFFVQAADIAAGIVAATWDQQSLVDVVRHFDYVTYNGERIGEGTAASISANLSCSR